MIYRALLRNMSQNTIKTEYKARIIADYLQRQVKSLRDRQGAGVEDVGSTGTGGKGRPLMVSMQGPQGAGKSTLAAGLVDLLASSDYGLKTAVASLDDFYLPHAGLKSLATSHASNALLAGRGPPGTHDIPLLASTLHDIARINTTAGHATAVNLPSFDKSLFNGEGDRSPTPIPLHGPIDIFILEGWCLGYSPIGDHKVLEQRWKAGRTASTHPLSTLQEINTNLAEFVSAIHANFDTHIAIQPSSFDYVYKWRTQQEHHMKSLNGGKGMSDEAVTRFVDRYMPVYECYAEDEHEAPCLTLYYGPDREVQRIEER